MVTIGTSCFLFGCTKKPMYFCCQPQAPACFDCSDEVCLKCLRPRTKPLKSFANSTNNQKAIKSCKSCSKRLEADCLTFSCQHNLCAVCAIKRVCEDFRSNNWQQNGIQSTGKVIPCQCQQRGSAKIFPFLQNYCLCCGECLRNRETVDLQFGYKILRSCKNRIKLSMVLEGSNEHLLSKEQLDKLYLRCGVCQTAIDQQGKCQYCDNLAKGQIVLKKKRSQENNTVLLVEPIVQQKGKTFIISDAFNSPFARNKKQKDKPETAKKQADYRTQKDETETKSLKKLAKQSSPFIHRNGPQQIERVSCSSCDRLFSITQLKDIEGLLFCRRCFEINQKHWIKQNKVAEVIVRQQQPVRSSPTTQNKGSDRPYFEPLRPVSQKKEQINKEQDNKKEELTTYICVNCSKQEPFCLTKTISSELGGFLCQKCVSQSRQAEKKAIPLWPEPLYLNPSPQKKQIESQEQENRRIHRIYSQPKPIKPQFQVFGRNLLLQSYHSERNTGHLQGSILATIYKEIPDEVDLFIQMQALMSCFHCGFFAEEDDMPIVQSRKVCMSCFLRMKNP